LLPLRAIALLALCSLFACTGEAGPVVLPDGGTQEGDCEVGTLACACASGDVCGTDLRGSALRCEEGICVSPDCVAGTTGCVCFGGTRCDAPGDACREGVCKTEDCAAGTLNCDCVAGTCNAGMHCDQGLGGGTCVDGTGYPGGACLPNRLCHGANRCDTQLAVCVPCEPGSQACIPVEGSACNAGLVLYAGHCLAPIDVPPSEEDRVCRTRCREDYDAPGDHRACIDGFIDGCVGDLACVDGSCVVPGEDPPACGVQTDCPDFQRCFANGRCYSECNTNLDCVDGYSCYRHSCRIPCQAVNAASPACPSGMHCDTRDGSSGVCMPLPEPTSSGPTPVLGSFTVAPEHLALAALTPSGTVSIEVDSASVETFEIVKVSQRVYDASGDEVSDPLGETDPLHFVELSMTGATESSEGRLSVSAPARCSGACPALTVTVTDTPNAAGWSRWEGELEVRHPTLGNKRIRLGYQASADGRWTGTMHYFASFPKGSLSEWRDGLVPSEQVGNGLIRAWGTFRRGRLPGGADALSALLLATSQESWRWPTVQSACVNTYKSQDEAAYPGACFLFDDGGASAVREYVEDLGAAPLPTGATELPIALDLRTRLGDDGLPEMLGVIDSGVALHYPGSPSVQISFTASPVETGSCDASNANDCVVYLDAFDADIRVGARMPPAADGTCEGGFHTASVPWLLPDFLGSSEAGSVVECLDERAPFPAHSVDNTNLSRANAFADGRPVVRELRLMDGALINQRNLVVLFEERFSSSLHPEGFSAYGYILLEHADALVDDAVFQEAEAAQALADTTTPDPSRPPLGPTCVSAWLRAILGEDFALPGGISGADDRALVEQVVQVMLTGRVGGADDTANDYDEESGLRDNVHVLCVDNGLIDGGADPAAPRPCPATSRVQFFFLPDPYNDTVDVPRLACQADTKPGPEFVGKCGDQLLDWSTSVSGIVLDPLWRCTDPDDAYCATDPSDPMAGKVFYETTDAAFLPLAPMIQEAFRYKTQFSSPKGQQVGFAPVVCLGSGSQTPYCYDPVAIEEILARVDCLLAMYDRYAAAEKSRPEWDALRAFLSTSLSHDGVIEGNGLGLLADGFERLYAELLVMLGDEAFTQALSSRFDLAATREAPFFGSRFEANGVDLSGIAGFEVRSLYRAAQYYELATERFFSRIAPVIRTALTYGDRGASGDAIVSQGLVTQYMERLIGGSTKRAKTYAEIARRYQSLNRPDLAEAVLARAYTSTYLESITLSDLMLGVAELSSSARDQVISEIEDAQRRYQVALHEMREVLSTVHDGVDQFGHTPDYVPFPATDDNDTRYANAFETVLGLARFRLETARRFEEDAIAANRDFETDTAAFQQELVQIARSFEDRLLELCGSFRGRDGHVYPAIAKYAALSDVTAAMATSPCGRIGNGAIYQQLGQIQLLDDQRVQIDTHLRNVLTERDDELARAARQCGRIYDFMDDWTTLDNQRIRLQDFVNGAQTTVSALDRSFNIVSQIAQAGFGSKPLVVGVAGAYFGAATALEVAIAARQHDLQKIDQGLRNLELQQECASLTIDTEFRVRAIMREALEVQLEALHLAHQASLAISELDRLYLEAQHTEERQRETEQLAINVQAARNDPNIRVYRNAAVINADRSFDRALEHAYRTTRMYEYYTSQTYAGRGDLYLIRMVARGVPNLVSYLDEIEDDYEAFRVEFRTRARRVRRISLLNDIFRVPYQQDGRELSEEERFRIMRERLLDPSRIDENGRRVVEFRTFADQTAPCTFSHQIDYIEIDLIGQNLGDEFANLLLWQDGTGVIESLSDGQVAYQLSPLLMVAQPHFNNSQRFDPSLYRRFEMRERPFINTSWKLVFDQHGDPDNQDISVDGLKDIHLYVHYTDFTDSGACR
jgi:hypothetical protein